MAIHDLTIQIFLIVSIEILYKNTKIVGMEALLRPNSCREEVHLFGFFSHVFHIHIMIYT